jgi:hypothetical protein
MTLILFLVTIFVYGALNYSGFCFKEMRYLSDAEKIELALNSIIKEQTSPGKRVNVFTDNDKLIVREIIPYSSKNDFIKKNTDCCKEIVPSNGIFAEDPSPTLFDRILGRYSYGIRVSYVEKRIETIAQKDGAEGNGKRYEVRIHGLLPYGNCGGPCETCGD